MAVAAAGLLAACTRDLDSAAGPTAVATGTITSTTATAITSTTTTSPTTSTTTTAATPTTSTTPTPTTTTTSTVATTTVPPATTVTTLPPDTTVPSAAPITPTTVDPTRTGSIWEVRPPSDIPPPPIPEGWAVAELAPSRAGRSIEVWSRVPAGAERRVVVVGGIHGNEPVSPPIVRALVEVAYPDDVAVWLVPELNPDGVAAGTRANATDVDLNRNFPWNWWPSDGGPGPLSEPETAAVAQLVQDLQPTVVVWVHQPLGYVSSIGTTPDVYEQAWSQASGVPVRPDVTQHGGGESWTNLLVGFPSMLIEVDGWDATPEIVAAHRAGFEALLAVL